MEIQSDMLHIETNQQALLFSLGQDENRMKESAGTRFAQDLPPDPDLDFFACDREPIHVPGSVQPHGFLLALEEGGRIVVASGSAEGYLRRKLPEVLGARLRALVGVGNTEGLLESMKGEALTPATQLLGTFDLPEAGAFDVVAYQGTEADCPIRVLEWEQQREPVNIAALNARLYNFIGSIRTQGTVEAVCRCAVDEIHTLTGCDRVVLYKFDDGGHGQVLAEARKGDRLPELMGLRFPASDVPAQARRMYAMNRVRIIPDVDYEPSPLFGLNGPAGEIDLSPSVLRSVSPIHREYMRNMGTRCSMSVSILIDGKLWGLVSCHHRKARFLPLRLRSACDFVVQIVASEIEGQEKSMRLERALEAKQVQNRLLALMASQGNYMEGLRRAPGLLQELVHADGVAVVAGTKAQLFGTTPSETEVLRLVEFLRETKQDELFHASRLGELYPAAEALTGSGAGAIVISVSRFHGTYLAWFRREVVETVRWAGNPQKPAAPESAGSAISPRHSFAEWQETVRGSAAPWSAEELDAARDFRAAVLEIVLSRAEEMEEMAAGLQVANEELEAFSYSVSHDLRAPFRHISGFSEMLRDEEGDRLTDRGRRHLQTIQDSARFAGLLVDSLLDFSRFARTKITMAPVDLEELVDEEWEAVVYDETRGREIGWTRGPLPRVLGDAQLLRQVLRNLFSNATKYTGRQEHPTVHMEAWQDGQEFIFSIRDNGVGFDGRFAEKLFGVFQRLHRVEEFEGTGIGLANVKRIVGRHGGRVWAKGEVGRGATFFFTMPALHLLEPGAGKR